MRWLSIIAAAAALAVLGPGAAAAAGVRTAGAEVAVAPQYDTTHVYVAPEDVDRFVQCFLATFGGHSTPQVIATVTPTPSSTSSQLLQTPVGTVSLFGFRTPIPYPFGAERTGYLVRDIDAAVASAQRAGAEVVVATFPDPIGRDAVIRWPGGVHMQLYWHTTAPNYGAFETVPENRVYLSPDRADAFVKAFAGFAHGKVASDVRGAPGIEIGRPGQSYRRVRIESGFGRLTALVTDGHLPYPYGRETTGYEVADLAATLAKAKAAGATVLVEPFEADGRTSAMLQFPAATSPKSTRRYDRSRTEEPACGVLAAGCSSALLFACGPARPDEAGGAAARPALQANRWQEDWSALADPALRTEPLDDLKYIPLGSGEPQRYLSFGATLRERFESNSAPALGGGADAYLLQRLLLHADLHLDANWRAFIQFEDARAFDKTSVGPADQNRADLRLAFVEYVRRFDAAR